jgi:hypothetical protein
VITKKGKTVQDELKTKVANDHTMFGDPIPGSKYYRTFCWSCGEPMRVLMIQINNPVYCEVCSEHKLGYDQKWMDLKELNNWPDGDEGIHTESIKKIRRKF